MAKKKMKINELGLEKSSLQRPPLYPLQGMWPRFDQCQDHQRLV